ncbi:MAG: hypothetical protein HZB12_02080 [Candidatus Yonathbacteria bacterium]|nr:hypothetical protein [Candidatus Yonathbacteria bacterium]
MNFIFANIDTIAIAVWLAFFVLVVVRTLRPALVKNVSYKLFVGLALGLYLLYGVVATWGQYRAWATSSDISRALLASPLTSEVPFPSYLEWTRPLFDHTHGYFWFYSFQHFFLSTIALIIIVGLFLLFLVVRSRTHPINFREGDIMLIVLAMLISGWPGVIVLLPIGLVSAILLSIVARIFYGIDRITLPPAFLLAAPFALIFATPILTAIHLSSILKL